MRLGFAVKVLGGGDVARLPAMAVGTASARFARAAERRARIPRRARHPHVSVATAPRALCQPSLAFASSRASGPPSSRRSAGWRVTRHSPVQSSRPVHRAQLRGRANPAGGGGGARSAGRAHGCHGARTRSGGCPPRGGAAGGVDAPALDRFEQGFELLSPAARAAWRSRTTTAPSASALSCA